MTKRMISDWLSKKHDTEKIPNYAKIGDKYKNISFAPNNEYSFPYMWGTISIIYSTNLNRKLLLAKTY